MPCKSNNGNNHHCKDCPHECQNTLSKKVPKLFFSRMIPGLTFEIDLVEKNSIFLFC